MFRQSLSDLSSLDCDSQRDLNGADHFSCLPSEIKLGIFQYLPFIDWVAYIAPVCLNWRNICTHSRVPKEIIVKKFVTKFGGIRASAFYHIAKNFQVTGIDLEGMPNDLYLNSDCSWIDIFSASSHLAWVNMKTIDESIYNEDDMPLDENTVTDISIDSWDLVEEVYKAFPQLRTLMVHNTIIRIAEDIKFLQLKTLHTIARLPTIDSIKKFLSWIKNVFAPKIESIYLIIQNKKEKKELIEQYEAVESHAKSLNIKLYCRDLYLLVNDPDSFKKSFEINGLPYSYYAYENKTLLGEAILAGSLSVVKFLLENKHTTLEKEVGPYPLPNIFDRCIGSKPASPPFLLPKHLTPAEKIVVDYLLNNGFDINKKVNGKLLFEEQILHSPLAKHLTNRNKVDWTNKTSEGQTVMHLVFEADALELFKEIIKMQSYSKMRELLYLRDIEGNTPLHCLAGCRPDFIPIIASFNPDWEIKNDAGETPLLSLVKYSSADFLKEMIEKIVALVPTVQEGILTELFRTQKLPEMLLTNISLLASKGINFNEKIRNEPAVTHLRCFSAPLLKMLTEYGTDIAAVNTWKRSLLYNLIETTQEDIADLLEILVKEYKLNVNHIDSGGMTPLIFAIKMQKDEPIIRKLIELGANPNLASPNTPPALYYMRFHLDEMNEICELLLQAGADPNQKFLIDEKTSTPLIALLTSYPNDELLQLFIQYGGNVHERDEVGNTLLHIVDSKDQIKALLQYIDPNTTNNFGETPLWGKVSDISPFIRKHANINHISINGSTALHTAMQLKDEEKARALLAVQNIDLSILDNCGRSFLHFIHRCPSLYDAILRAFNRLTDEKKQIVRAAVNNVDFFNKTAVHYAVKTANESLVRDLIQSFGLDVKPLTDYTPLHQCVSSLDNNYYSSLKIAKFLCDLGVDVNASMKSSGNTALLIVCAKHPNTIEMKRLLLSYGADITRKNSKSISAMDIDPKLKAGYGTDKKIDSQNNKS